MQAREVVMGPASPAVGIQTPLQCKQTIHKRKFCGVGAPTPSDDLLLSASRPSPAGGDTNPVVAAQTPNSKVQDKNTTHAGTNSCDDTPTPSDDALLLYEFNKPSPPMPPAYLANLAIFFSG